MVLSNGSVHVVNVLHIVHVLARRGSYSVEFRERKVALVCEALSIRGWSDQLALVGCQVLSERRRRSPVCYTRRDRGTRQASPVPLPIFMLRLSV